MYTLGNLVYITDDTSMREITSYYLPINMPMAPLTPGDLYDYERSKDHLRRNPNLCTSHTVIVVDHSRFVCFLPRFCRHAGGEGDSRQQYNLSGMLQK